MHHNKFMIHETRVGSRIKEGRSWDSMTSRCGKLNIKNKMRKLKDRHCRLSQTTQYDRHLGYHRYWEREGVCVSKQEEESI